jgi:hypothetical protein
MVHSSECCASCDGGLFSETSQTWKWVNVADPRRPVFVLKLRPEPRVDHAAAVRALRQLLKVLLRRHGLKCIQILSGGGTMSRKLKMTNEAEYQSEESAKPKPAIAKPPQKEKKFDLNLFKSSRTSSGTIEKLVPILPVHSMADAKDFCRLHPDEEAYWTTELCFINVPVKGQRKELLHIITEELAVRFLRQGQIIYRRLALATRPFDDFFLATIPNRNLDNEWNATNLLGCEAAKEGWVQLVSRRRNDNQQQGGKEGYERIPAKEIDAFPAPKWLTQALDELIETTFEGRMIVTDDHPGLARVIGRKPLAT